MKITKVCCQGCGADLEVDELIRFVTCNYCNARLEIVHDKTTTHSKVLEKIERQTEEMADDLKVIRLQNELEKLDREWAMKSESLMVTSKNGVKSKPSKAASVGGGVFAILFGVLWMIMAASMGAPGIFPLFGLLFIGFAIFGMTKGGAKAGDYQAAYTLMNTQRQKILAEIEKAKRGG